MDPGSTFKTCWEQSRKTFPTSKITVQVNFSNNPIRYPWDSRT